MQMGAAGNRMLDWGQTLRGFRGKFNHRNQSLLPSCVGYHIRWWCYTEMPKRMLGIIPLEGLPRWYTVQDYDHRLSSLATVLSSGLVVSYNFYKIAPWLLNQSPKLIKKKKKFLPHTERVKQKIISSTRLFFNQKQEQRVKEKETQPCRTLKWGRNLQKALL